MKTTKTITAIALASAALAASTSAADAKTMKMTVVAAAPPIVTYVKVTKLKIIPEINRRLAASGKDFKIEWTQAYAQSLAKFTEVFEAVEENVAQVGLVLKNFEPFKLSLEQYPYVVPFARHTPAQMEIIERNMRKKVPELTSIYLKYDHVYLASGTSPSMHMFTNFPMTKVSDLKGHKIGASGSMGLWLKGTGAVRVNSSMANSFTDIKNGLYDGYPISAVLAFPYQTYRAAKYFTRVNFGVSATSTFTVNKDTWDSMPRHAREIFRDVTKNYAKWQAGIDKAKIAKFIGIMKKKGMQESTLANAERRKWAMNMPNIAKEWSDRLEKKGLPARKVVKAFMDEVRALNVDVARHWDRE
jgi:TRAP-type transport system periplasmic protein